MTNDSESDSIPYMTNNDPNRDKGFQPTPKQTGGMPKEFDTVVYARIRDAQRDKLDRIWPKLQALFPKRKQYRASAVRECIDKYNPFMDVVIAGLEDLIYGCKKAIIDNGPPEYSIIKDAETALQDFRAYNEQEGEPAPTDK